MREVIWVFWHYIYGAVLVAINFIQISSCTYKRKKHSIRFGFTQETLQKNSKLKPYESLKILVVFFVAVWFVYEIEKLNKFQK